MRQLAAEIVAIWIRRRARNNTRIERLWFRSRGHLWRLLRIYLMYRTDTTIWLIDAALRLRGTT